MIFPSDAQARLAAIGWRGPLPAAHGGPHGQRLARVAAQHRNGYVLHDGEREIAAAPAPRFLRHRADPAERPAVGDFVLADRADPAIIHTVLPRRTTLSRAAAGERYARQIIAANIDTVFVLMGLDGDFNPRRVERYLLLIAGSGALPVVTLTKRDKAGDAATAAALAALRDCVPATIEMHAINAKDTATLAPLLRHLQTGDTAVLVGSSGAGKSTLTNTLLGRDRQSTGTVREHDSRGRHTTTQRALLPLPGGGCLIDTPGMRELKPIGDESLSLAGFADIQRLAAQCRFADCAHDSEPGCAVRAAIGAGLLDEARLASFGKLREELAAADDSRQAQLERRTGARNTGKRPAGKRR